jgi:hypothetical protein
LAADAEYAVIVSTGGGLYRYRLGYRVRVCGQHGKAPCLRFLGKTETVSDRVGEKLHQAHVQRTQENLAAGAFGFWAPETASARDVLYVDAMVDVEALDGALGENAHYRYARELGQLAAPEVVRVDDLHGRYLQLKGRGTGSTVKPRCLEQARDWRRELCL